MSMRVALAVLLIALAACRKSPTKEPTVELTAVTLGDDCGASAAVERDSSSSKPSSYAPTPCQQTSMQLAIKAVAGTSATKITIKKIELFDEKGKRLGALVARTPTVWRAGSYRPWDGTIAESTELLVSYELSRPPLDGVDDRKDQTFVLKAIIVLDGGERSVRRDVLVKARTYLPADAAT